jgi:hypothetical protein
MYYGLQTRTDLQSGKRTPCLFSKFARFRRRTHKFRDRKNGILPPGTAGPVRIPGRKMRQTGYRQSRCHQECYYVPGGFHNVEFLMLNV